LINPPGIAWLIRFGTAIFGGHQSPAFGFGGIVAMAGDAVAARRYRPPRHP